MPKPESNPEHLFTATRADYYDTPKGCLRFLQIDKENLIGTRYGKTYTIPLSQVTPARSTK